MLFFALAVVVVASFMTPSAATEENIQPTVGKICAFADFNRDKYTDLLVVNDQHLFVRLQNEDGEFKDGPNYLFIKLDQALPDFKLDNILSCAVGDFDGNSHADILVTRRSGENFAAAVCYLQPNVGFNCSKLGDASVDGEMPDQPIVVDVDADGISDILAFVEPKESSSPIKCYRGQEDQRKFVDCSDVFKNFTSKLNPNFAHAFVDIDDDLSAELVFGVNDSLGLEVWKRNGGNKNWTVSDIISSLPAANDDKVTYGQPIFGDINADGRMDILLPRCDGSEFKDGCKLKDLLVWERKAGWTSISVNIDPYRILGDVDDRAQLRMGDFDLDGFPDLVAVLKTKDKHDLFIFKNVPCDETPDCKNITRTFKLEENSRLIESPDISAGTKTIAAFFDVREDGNLDVLVEYTKDGTTSFNFIPCDDKGDTTFLKVEMFTKICYQKCKDSGGSGQNSYGSSISWHGATLKYTMSDTSGDQRHGVQTQMAQTSHRTLQLPFATFGLGRSPNFVDTLTVGTPAHPAAVDQSNHWTQLVPNARLYIIPPGPDGPNGQHGWISRLYMTPSRLIIQSLIVLVAVCGIIIVIIAFLHWRERKQDLVERQAQAHRFHFDAM